MARNVYKGTVSTKDFLGDYLDFHVKVGDVVLPGISASVVAHADRRCGSICG
jgi:hypothetical protein